MLRWSLWRSAGRVRGSEILAVTILEARRSPHRRGHEAVAFWNGSSRKPRTSIRPVTVWQSPSMRPSAGAVERSSAVGHGRSDQISKVPGTW
jgi:hypothetical protein